MVIVPVIIIILLFINYKNNILNIIDDRQNQILVYICLTLYSIKDIFIYFYNIYELDHHDYFSNYEYIQAKINMEKNIPHHYLNMDKGNGQGSSKNPFPNSSGPREGNNSPINYGDYDWSSDSDSSIRTNNNFRGIPSKFDIPNLANIPKIKSPLEAFKESVYKATPEELQTKINDLKDQLDMYYKSGLDVPAAKSQIDMLQNKLDICFSKVSETQALPDRLSEEKVDLKGKGKEIDLKGKGKAK